jgi:hypothetical protein
VPLISPIFCMADSLARFTALRVRKSDNKEREMMMIAEINATKP